MIAWKFFFCFFMSLLTASIVKNILTLPGITISKERPRTNLKGFQYQILDLSEKIQKVVIKKDRICHFFAS